MAVLRPRGRQVGSGMAVLEALGRQVGPGTAVLVALGRQVGPGTAVLGTNKLNVFNDFPSIWSLGRKLLYR